VSTAQMATEYFCGESNDVLRDLLMTSIAGMTVARFGVPREKYRVVSLKI